MEIGKLLILLRHRDALVSHTTRRLVLEVLHVLRGLLLPV